MRGRSIHDNFRAVQQSCKLLHAKRTPTILLKVDIAKAFDTVSWEFLLEVMQHLGFGLRWRDWLSALLSTASTKVLLNGRPGRRICHARGLRQGDPLSPLLFVLVMEVLNHMILWLENNNFLTPLGAAAIKCRSSLYADDLVLFVVPQSSDLLAIHGILRAFASASGLSANLEKSVATPIYCSPPQIELTQQILACRVEDFPSRYLGVPLSIYKL